MGETTDAFWARLEAERRCGMTSKQLHRIIRAAHILDLAADPKKQDRLDNPALVRVAHDAAWRYFGPILREIEPEASEDALRRRAISDGWRMLAGVYSRLSGERCWQGAREAAEAFNRQPDKIRHEMAHHFLRVAERILLACIRQHRKERRLQA